MTHTTTASTVPTPDSARVEWHAVDADDRWPGRWTAHIASVHAHGRTYLIRITPGDCATYLAPGFYADVDGGYGQRWGMRAATLDEAKRRAAMSQPTATPADVPANAAKDRHTLRARSPATSS